MAEKTETTRLTREQILGTDDIATELVEIDKWGGHVIVRELTAGERNKVGTQSHKSGGTLPEDFFPMIASWVMIGKDGQPLFKKSDAFELGKKSWTAIENVVSVALRLSGMTEESANELGKDSKAAPAASSSSD
jgi:hypothetical protein